MDKRRRNRVLVCVPLFALLLLLWFPGPCAGKADEPFDYIAAQARELEHDQQRIIEFVRDRIAHRSYSGQLRGAVGTLWSGAGNDVDQAVLLTALLRESDLECRLARGDSTWVQVRDGDGWRDVQPVPSLTTGTAGFTDPDPPDDTRHDLSVSLECAGAELSSSAALALTTAECAGHPLILSFIDGEAVLRLHGTDRAVRLKVGGAEDETLTLAFRHTAPGQEPRRFTREIYTRAHEEYRALDDPRDVHVIAITTGRVPRWVLERETELVEEGPAPLLDPNVRDGYILALRYMFQSDRALDALGEHFGTAAWLDRPRVIIVSTFHGDAQSEPTYRAIDLRANAVHVEGDETTRARLAVARSAFEGALESELLSVTSGHVAWSAMSALSQLVDPVAPTTPERLLFYDSSLAFLFEEADPGTRLVFSLDDRREVAFRRAAGPALVLEPIAPPLADAMARSGVEWLALGGSELTPENRNRAAWELETLFGPVARAPLDYRPRLTLEETPAQLVEAGRARIHLYRPLYPDQPLTLTYELQLRYGERNHELSVVDYWNEKTEQPDFLDNRFELPVGPWQDSHLFARFYDQTRFWSGARNFFCSQAVYRELQEEGQSVIEHWGPWGNSDPIRLFLCETREHTIHVNGRPRTVQALYAAGDYAADESPQKPYDEVEPFGGHSGGSANRWIILDDPQVPLFLTADGEVSFRSVIPGNVVSQETGYGIPGVEITIEGAGSSGRSWGDGRFRLPLFEGRFTTYAVHAACPGYEPLRVEVDFSQRDALPLRLELTPKVDPDLFAWVSQENADEVFADATWPPRVQHLVRTALQENPDVVVLLPRRRVAIGASASYVWLLFDQADFHVVGVTEDGLHGSAVWGAMLEDWVKNGMADEPCPFDMQSGAIQYFAAYFMSWYAYSAGRIDALGTEHDKDGHAYAIAVAKAFLDRLDSITDTTAGGYVSDKLGFKKKQFMAGFMDGLAYFESEPTFWQ